MPSIEVLARPIDGAGWVQVGPDVVMPEAGIVTTTHHRPGLPDLTFTATVVAEPGGLRWTDVHVTGDLDAETLRTFPWAKLRAGAVLLARQGTPEKHQPRKPWTDEEREQLAELRATSRRRLEAVAYVYTLGTIAALRPTQEVQGAFGVPYGTAARWVKLARDAGLLPAARKGD